MSAPRINGFMLTAIAAGLILAGCKGHGSSSSSIPQSNTNWIWEASSNAANSPGYYANQGTASSTVQPAGRFGAQTWNVNGQYWVFGGSGGYSDTWTFSTSTLQWAWMAGNSSAVNPTGIYGTLGTAAASNLPGQRSYGASWTDASGKLWMFGGYGADSNGLIGYLNDVWTYNTTQNWWTWVAGSNQASGLASTTNSPAPRSNSTTWTGTSNGSQIFYMFGGTGGMNITTSSGTSFTSGYFNDLWTFNPSTLQWTMIGGSSSMNASGNYTTGTLQPGARQSATGWVDSSGNFWLFGGVGYDASGNLGPLNDLWKYTPSTNVWTFVKGASGVNQIGNYGTNAVASSTNVPGARSGSVGWIDGSGNLWLFGGNGINSSGSFVTLNDFWEYITASNEWVWFNGSYNGNVGGYYGTLGVLSSYNMPGARYGANAFKDTSGNFWLFGGLGYDAASSNGKLADMWKYLAP